MRILYFLGCLFFGIFSIHGQTAQVQFIHNSPTLGTDFGPVLDIYVNGQLNPALSSFSFRSATPFLSLPAEEPIELIVKSAPSTLNSDTLAVFHLDTLDAALAYTIVVGGVNINIPQLPDFQIFVSSNAELSSVAEDRVFMNAFHGGILLPQVNIGLLNIGSLYNLSFGNFSAYQFVDADFLFFQADVQNLGFPLSYLGDFRGQGGKAATLFISGAAVNNPEWGLFAAFTDGEVREIPLTLLAPVQVFNNSPSGSYSIFLNGTKWIDSLDFATGRPYTFVEADNLLSFGIAPAGANDTSQIIHTFEIGFQTDQYHQLVISGLENDTLCPIDLVVNREDQIDAADENGYEFTFFHGAADSMELLISGKGRGVLLDSIGYHAFSEYIAVPDFPFYLDVRSRTDSSIVATFLVELPELAKGQAVSFFFARDTNDVYFLTALLTDGSSIAFEGLQYTRTQWINNIPGESIRIYENGDVLVDSLGYLEATSFLLLPAHVDWHIRVEQLATGSTIIIDTLRFTDSIAYSFVVNGVLGEEDFPFNWQILNWETDGQLAEASLVSHFYHGLYGADNLQIGPLGEDRWIDSLSFSHFSSQLTIDKDVYLLDVRSPDANLRFTFEADLAAGEAQRAVIIASGLWDGESAFSMLAVYEDGSVIPFQDVSVARVQWIHHLYGVPVDIYLNDSLWLDDFLPVSATPFLNLEGGVEHLLGIAPSNSTSVNDTIASIAFNPMGRVEYSLILTAMPEDADRLFDIFIHENSRSSAIEEDSVEVLLFHSSFLFPALEGAFYYEQNVWDSLSFGSFASYQRLPASFLMFSLLNGIFADSLTNWSWDLRMASGQSFTLLFAEQEDDFSAYVLRWVDAQGNMGTLSEIEMAHLQWIHSFSGAEVRISMNDYVIASDLSFPSATPFLPIPADEAVLFGIHEIRNGQVLETLWSENVNWRSEELHIAYFYDPGADVVQFENFRAAEENVEADTVAYNFFHGAFGVGSIRNDVSVDIVTLLELNEGEVSGMQLLPIGTYLGTLTRIAEEEEQIYFKDLREAGGQEWFIWLYLDPTESLHIFAANRSGQVLKFPFASMANLQLLHNAPASAVDIYLYDKLWLEAVEFRTGTPFLSVPAGIPLEIHVHRKDSLTAFYSAEVMLTADENYLAIAYGLPGNIQTPFELAIIENARTSSDMAGSVDIGFFHGSPDLQTLRWMTRNAGLWVDSLAYGDWANYINLIPQRYLLDILDQSNGNLLSSWEAGLGGLVDRAGVIFTSGVLGDEEAEIGLYILLDSGTVAPLSAISLARVQFLHNAIADTLDVYYGDELLIPSMVFRSATGYLELPAFPGIFLKVANAGSSSAEEAFFELEPNFENAGNYLLSFNGIEGQSSGVNRFRAIIRENARRTATGAGIDLLALHGAPGLPGVDFTDEEGELLFRDLRFAEFSDYVNLPSTNAFIQMERSGSGEVIQNYVAAFSMLGGQSVCMFISGEAETEDFGLWGLLANGFTFPFDLVTSAHEQIQPNAGDLRLFPNPAHERIMFSLEGFSHDALVQILNVQGIVVHTQNISPLSMASPGESIDISKLVPGYYQMLITDGDTFRTSGFIKK